MSNTDVCETSLSAFDSMIGCRSKQDHDNNHRICEMLILNELDGTTASSTCLSVACLDLKTDYTQNKLLHIQSAARQTPNAGNDGILLHKYGKMTKEKLKSSRLS